MKKIISKTVINLFASMLFLIVLVTNGLASFGLINNQKPQDVSDSYPNLFAPAGYTFSIWGVIYLLLIIHIFYLFKNKDSSLDKTLKETGIYFALSSIANFCWIFAWHYNNILLSLLCISVILFSLAIISNILRKGVFSTNEKLMITAPFSVYFGWITVATIANLVVFLVSLGWDGMSKDGIILTIFIMAIVAIIASLIIIKQKNTAYGFVVIWAYIGILYKHLSSSGFNGEYPAIITTVIVCLILLAIPVVHLFVMKIKKQSK